MGSVTPAALAAHLQGQGYDITEDVAREFLDSYVASSFMVRNADGTYSPTDLGRVVAYGAGGVN